MRASAPTFFAERRIVTGGNPRKGSNQCTHWFTMASAMPPYRKNDTERYPTADRFQTSRARIVCGDSPLENQRILRQIGVLGTEMLHFLLVLVSQIVKAQAVLLRIHNGHQPGLKLPALASVQQTLEHRILHPLAVIHAFFGDLPQTLPAGGVLRVHIVSNQYQHSLTSTERADRRPDRPG